MIAFVGVVVLAAGPGLSANALPLLLVIGAAFAFAVSNVLTKRYGPLDPLMLMGWSSLLTVPQVMLMSLRVPSCLTARRKPVQPPLVAAALHATKTCCCIRAKVRESTGLSISMPSSMKSVEQQGNERRS